LNKDVGKEYPVDFDLVEYDEVDSTNDELRRILEQHKGDVPFCAEEHKKVRPLCVVAKQQTNGRGRLGRRWESPQGGLYTSLALEVSDASTGIASLSLLVALAIRKELEELSKPVSKQEPAEQPAQQEILVKWPNDIVCSQGKLAGILIELIQLTQEESTSQQQYALIGVGINIKRPAEGASERAAFLSDFCSEIPKTNQLAIQVITGILAYHAHWKEAGYDFASYTSEYNANHSLTNEEVVVSNSEGEVLSKGTVQGVDTNGFLLLLNDKGNPEKVGTGEVTLGGI